MIDKQTFLNQFKEQYIGETSSLTLESEFRKIDSWDSLTGMSILVMIKDEYDIDMSADALKACITIGDVYDFVEKNVADA
ncbi:acyl carrier protein [Chitinophaga filiformis]|uniref:Acyl carrier protein n=1 Tax=Chitinophaga filiformis TaxID=104663 RepID=A0ABY4I6M5_CHIFI|nr:acyl carrier protein [Chitinophaga filiformis]UPK70421.1 acyl carrier protein [Chitinophaga filiformis]